MKTIVFILFIATCYGKTVEFSARLRNFSTEIVYFVNRHSQINSVPISTFGIWTLLTSITFGATGDSYEQLRRACILPRSKDAVLIGYKNLTNILNSTSNGVSFVSQNYVFIDDDTTIKADFKKRISTDFGANIKILDFKEPDIAARVANNYIQNSGVRVTNVLKSDDFVESKMILTHVASFKGLWSYPFNVNYTRNEIFYNENNEVIGRVNMMPLRAKLPFSYIPEIKAFVVDLPYGTDKKYSMLVILPHSATKIKDTYQWLANVTLLEIARKLQSDVDEFGLEDVHVKLPRFKINTNVLMNKPLNDMGVYDIFHPGFASFKNLTDADIFVSSVLHVASIEITESGIAAPASDAARFVDRGAPASMNANRPFIYFIIERSTVTVIIGGMYSKPTVY